MATRSPITSEIQITERTASQAEAQRGRRIDGAAEVGVGDQPVRGGRRKRGRDQADDEQQHLEDRERARDPPLSRTCFSATASAPLSAAGSATTTATSLHSATAWRR